MRIFLFLAVCILSSCKNDILVAGEKLEVNEVLVSNNRKYKLIMQENGDLVLYSGINIPMWSSFTAGQAITTLVLEKNGELVLYGEQGKIFWKTETSGNANAYLLLQDDGNLVLCNNGRAIWSTNTDQIN